MNEELIKRLVLVAASLNDATCISDNPEYLRGQAELIAYATSQGADAVSHIRQVIVQKVRSDAAITELPMYALNGEAVER